MKSAYSSSSAAGRAGAGLGRGPGLGSALVALISYLTVQGAATAIEFYARAFGARERMRLPSPVLT